MNDSIGNYLIVAPSYCSTMFAHMLCPDWLCRLTWLFAMPAISMSACCYADRKVIILINIIKYVGVYIFCVWKLLQLSQIYELRFLFFFFHILKFIFSIFFMIVDFSCHIRRETGPMATGAACHFERQPYFKNQ